MKSLKTKIVLLSLGLLCMGYPAEAQILKKLKNKVAKAAEKILMEKAEEKSKKTTSDAFDSIANLPNKIKKEKGEKPNNKAKVSQGKSDNPAKLVNTDAKRAFYKEDILVEMWDKDEGKSRSHFDADELAMRTETPKNDQPNYTDSEGFVYGYSEGNNRWEKTSIMNSDAMSFMFSSLSMGLLKLPVKPMMDATEMFKKQGLTLNTFQMIEWAFIYKPAHFKNNDFTETTVDCASAQCQRFLYNEAEYLGSYVQFDASGRLSNLYLKVSTPQGPREGSYDFKYQSVEVELPNAVEVKMPFQDLFMKGAAATPPTDHSDVADDKLDYNQSQSSSSSSSSSPSNSNNGNDPNESIAKINPNDSYSFPGITAIIKSKKEVQTYRLDTKNFVMETEFTSDGQQPMYWDRFGYVYTHDSEGYIKAKMDFSDKRFNKMSGTSQMKLPENISMTDIRNNVYAEHYGLDVRPKLFPIAEWAFVYRPAFFQDEEKFEKELIDCRGGKCERYTLREGKEKGSFVLFDPAGRLAEIFSKAGGEGKVTYTYESHDLTTPVYYKEFDMGGFMGMLPKTKEKN